MITSFDYDSIMFVLESLEGYRLPETELAEVDVYSMSGII